jgi:mevalonate kinase
MNSFYSHGKLLLTGEYVVLKGAHALAIPCSKGQRLTFTPNLESTLVWESYDTNKTVWFSAQFDLSQMTIRESSNPQMAKRLAQVLLVAKEENQTFLQYGGRVETHLEFDQNWGLGSSSTLIASIAQWAQVNPFVILERSFGGSGYDVACAQATTPIVYTRNGTSPQIKTVSFRPSFIDNLFFVYLNQKKDSSEAVRDFSSVTVTEELFDKINDITNQLINCTTQNDFNDLLQLHESIIGKLIGQTPIQERLFADFEGRIKSLGAWGGDFILASGNSSSPSYFANLGYSTVIPYKEMCL